LAELVKHIDVFGADSEKIVGGHELRASENFATDIAFLRSGPDHRGKNFRDSCVQKHRLPDFLTALKIRGRQHRVKKSADTPFLVVEGDPQAGSQCVGHDVGEGIRGDFEVGHPHDNRPHLFFNQSRCHKFSFTDIDSGSSSAFTGLQKWMSFFQGGEDLTQWKPRLKQISRVFRFFLANTAHAEDVVF
jgi:hypothetical protein